MNVYNAAERAHVKAAAKAAKVADRERREIVGGIMSVAPGRSWMLDLLERCHIFQVSFNGNALASAFAEGERNVGLKLLNDIMSFCPDQYIAMMQERNERDRANESRRSRTNHDGGDQGPDSTAGDEAGTDDAGGQA
jgi:hypothetical protein